ncbi:2-oxoglutarate dehydrogenase E1 component [Granulicella mallensis]|uniref:oxoglutarate dehydrogenase (succinyl-transferring) n=1 Tax=Granulicella mallensis (strain ATCC BAA-1857 / DSM 23137 / MP5ACTX8) TaxID=682795 RepID=G8NVB2_GRAMM|nr:2-oxoglutarate dehydrogenase E1 component [Granulicella mallensis]AEU35401.1 2-oxoglutarate dehydrogenase, E1 subunit [Granulicella mallensis MP5ACTX8]
MPTKTPTPSKPSPSVKTSPASNNGTAATTRETTFDIFRRWGYLQASLDPLGQYLPPEPFPTPAPDGADSEEARRYYCGSIGAEFMHIPSPEKRAWIQEQLERDLPAADTARILTGLIRADIFEQVIQQRYLGTKRFSLEGLTVLIPFLDQVFTTSADNGVTRSVFAMSHRGRLNVMVNTIGRASEEVFTKFEDVDPRSIMGGGDVKYHTGATGDFVTPNGKSIHLHLASNPSHLEAADPVIMGRARAYQERIGQAGRKQVLPLIIHGDAAFAGQGIWAETLNLASLHGYNVGGTIQVIVNNLLGFTALPEESNSSRFASDLAKRLPIPIFHVNAEDPEAVARIAILAADYRHTFGSDVVVDLIGYRRHGHSEVDDPTVTQPRRYALIKDHPPLYKLYAEKLGVDTTAEIAEVQQEFLEDQKSATHAEHKPTMHTLPEYWAPYYGGRLRVDDNPNTGLDAAEITSLTKAITTAPEGFHLHPKVKKTVLDQRIEMGEGKKPFDYGTAELLAYASLLKAGTPVRLTGQDSQRGTFNQRHSVLIDIETEVRYSPLSNIAPNQGHWEVYNSMLSEAACLGYEYGFSRDFPEALTLWEAQFGDFANGAQIIIDQFISASEAKWGLLSGLVMLLPHGYEGQGPEHSSARMERYLQLAAQDNIQIAQPSTAAQYFHLLRRQAMRKWRKPLIVFTPKSMLRHPDAMSSIADLGKASFQNVLPDNEVQNPRRLLVCTGKIGHNLRVERAKRNDMSVGIVFVEQLYPWPEAELKAALDQHPDATEIVWVQEEPANMGALSFVQPRLKRVAGDRPVLTVKRTASASPATGSAKAHEMEEKTLIDLALGHGL